eukprot:UN19754
MADALDEVLPTAIQNNFEKEIDRAIKASVEHAFQNCGAEYGAELTDEQEEKFISLLQEKLMPFYMSLIR